MTYLSGMLSRRSESKSGRLILIQRRSSNLHHIPIFRYFMPAAVMVASRSLSSWIRITTRSLRESPRLKERGQASSLPNLTAYFWRCVARDHRPLKSESSHRHSRLSRTVLNLNGGTKFPGSRGNARSQGRLPILLLLISSLAGVTGLGTLGLRRDGQAF